MFPFFLRIAIASLLLWTPFAQAQVRPVSSVDASSTITSTGVYQSVFAHDNNRSGCAIQNNGTHNMSVKFAGGTAWTLVPSQIISCISGPTVLTDAVTITGTAGDAFTAAYQ